MQLRLGGMLVLAFAHGFVMTTVHMHSVAGVLVWVCVCPYRPAQPLHAPLHAVQLLPARRLASLPTGVFEARVLSVEATQNAAKPPGQFLTIHLSAATGPQVLGVAQVLQAASAQRRENLGSWLQAWKDTRGQV